MPYGLDRTEASDNEETLDLELEGFSPDPPDKAGIGQLLFQLFPDSSGVNIDNLSDYIIANNTIGTVVKNHTEDGSAEEDDDDIVFALTTVVDLSPQQCKRWIAGSQIKNFAKKIINNCSNSNFADNKVELNEILSDSGSIRPYLLINERLTPLPPKVCSSSLTALFEEINSIKPARRPSHVLIIAKHLRVANRATTNYNCTRPEYIYPEIERIRDLSLCYVESDLYDEYPDAQNESKSFYSLIALKFDNINSVLCSE